MNKNQFLKFIFSAIKLVIFIGIFGVIFKAGGVLAFEQPTCHFEQNGFFNAIYSPSDLGNYYARIYRIINGKYIFIGTVGPSRVIGSSNTILQVNGGIGNTTFTYNQDSRLGNVQEPLYDDILTYNSQYNYYVDFYTVWRYPTGAGYYQLNFSSTQSFSCVRSPSNLPKDLNLSNSADITSPTGHNEIKMVGDFIFNNIILDNGWNITGRPQFEELTLFANKITINAGSKIDYSGAANFDPGITQYQDNDVISDDCLMDGGAYLEPSVGGGGNGGKGGTGSFSGGLRDGWQPSPSFDARNSTPHGLDGLFYSGTRGGILWGTKSFDPYHIAYNNMWIAGPAINSGGGNLHIVTKILDNKGQIISNGFDGQNANYGYGGGAGGSITIDAYEITTSSVSGKAEISVNGGAGGSSVSGMVNGGHWHPDSDKDGYLAGGGGGGGGTIAIKSVLYNGSTINTSGQSTAFNFAGGSANTANPYQSWRGLPGTSIGQDGWAYLEPGGDYSLREEENKLSRTVTQGNSVAFKISADAINGLSLPINFTTESLSGDLTAKNIVLSLAPSGGALNTNSLKSSLNIQTQASTPVGTYKINLISLPNIPSLAQDVSDLLKRTLRLEIVVQSPGSFSVNNVASDCVGTVPKNTITWSKLDGATSYIVNKSTDGNSYSTSSGAIGQCASSECSYTEILSALDYGKTYYYKISAAKTGVANLIWSSNVKSVQTKSCGATPTLTPNPINANLVLTGSSYCEGGAPKNKLTFQMLINNNEISSYVDMGIILYRNDGWDNIHYGNNDPFIEGTYPGQQYTYYVKTTDGSSYASSSAPNGQRYDLSNIQSDPVTVTAANCNADLVIDPIDTIDIDFNSSNRGGPRLVMIHLIGDFIPYQGSVYAEASDIEGLENFYVNNLLFWLPGYNSSIANTDCHWNIWRGCTKYFYFYLPSTVCDGTYTVIMHAHTYISGPGDMDDSQPLTVNVKNSKNCKKSMVTFKGFFIGNSINITRQANSAPYSIEYDPVAAQNPPPGFADLLAPLWSETSP
jgi:hypothetical protein